MIILHHLKASRSQRVLWLLEEIGLPYEVRRYDREAGTDYAPADLLQVHPLGKSPVIEDDGRVIAESGAIVDYLCQRHAPDLTVPPASPQWPRYVQLMHYAEGSAMAPLMLEHFLRPFASTAEALGPRVETELGLQSAYMAKVLGEEAWFMGDRMTAVDVMMVMPVLALARAGRLERCPVLLAYLGRITGRPAWQRGILAGDQP